MGKLSRDSLQLGSLINDESVNCQIYVGYNGGDLIAEHIEGAEKSVKICAPFVSGVWLKKLTDKKKANADFEILLISCSEQFKQSVKNDKTDNNSETSAGKDSTNQVNSSNENGDKNIADAKATNKESYVRELNDEFKKLRDVGAKICLYETLGAFDYDGKIFDRKVKQYLQLHAKIYLIDDKILYLASGNFGRGGMKTNLEFRVRIERGQGVGLGTTEDLFCKVIKLFEDLGKNNCKLKCDEGTL